MCESGDTEGGTICVESIIGDGERNGRLYGVLKFAAGIPSEGAPVAKNDGLAYSEGDVVVAADMGYGR